MNMHDELDRQITQALEAAPLTAVPDDFARRGASQLPQHRPKASLPAFRYTWARALSYLCVAVLIMALFTLGLSRHTGPSHLEMVLTAKAGCDYTRAFTSTSGLIECASFPRQ